LSEHFANGSIVLMGPVSERLEPTELDSLRSLPNVHFLPPCSRHELPAHVVHLDCALMPYRETEWLRYGAPLKLWDYFFAGPPIVGSGCAALLEHPPPLVHYAKGPDDFARGVATALSAPDIGRSERRQRALANTWSDRAEQLRTVIRTTTPADPAVRC
jgi:hypothetical protein